MDRYTSFWNDDLGDMTSDMDFLGNEMKRTRTSGQIEYKRHKPSIDTLLENNKSNKNKILHFDGDLMSINSLPEEIKDYDWVETLIIESTDIEMIDNVPQHITNIFIKNNKHLDFLDASVMPDSVTSFKCQQNNIQMIVGLQNGIIDLDLSNNLLRDICEIPESVINIDISANMFLMEIPKLYNNGENIKLIKLNNTSIKNIDILHDNIEIIEACRCNIQMINKFPKKLIKIKAYISNIESINCTMPEFIEEFDIYNNSIITCPDFPKSIKYIDLGNNNLSELPKIDSDAICKFDIKCSKGITSEMMFKYINDNKNLNINHDKIIEMRDTESKTEYEPSSIDHILERLRNTSNNIIHEENTSHSADISSIIARLQKKPEEISEFNKSNPHYIIHKKTITF